MKGLLSVHCVNGLYVMLNFACIRVCLLDGLGLWHCGKKIKLRFCEQSFVGLGIPQAKNEGITQTVVQIVVEGTVNVKLLWS